jgi:hypothetical protein
MEVSGQLHVPDDLPHGTQWMGGWVGHKSCPHSMEKRKSCTAWNGTHAGQPDAISSELSILLVFVQRVFCFLIMLKFY